MPWADYAQLSYALGTITQCNMPDYVKEYTTKERLHIKPTVSTTFSQANQLRDLGIKAVRCCDWICRLT